MEPGIEPEARLPMEPEKESGTAPGAGSGLAPATRSESPARPEPDSPGRHPLSIESGPRAKRAPGTGRPLDAGVSPARAGAGRRRPPSREA